MARRDCLRVGGMGAAFGAGISSEVFEVGWRTKFGIDYKDLQRPKTNERLPK